MARRFKRRDLFKGAQVAGAAATAAGLVLVARQADATQVRGTCRLCTMHCGLVAARRGGRLERIEGDINSRTRGFICHHAYALREIVHAPDRIRRPLKREGSAFREISWTQALGEIAERMLAVKKEFGAQALAVHTGWPFVRNPIIQLLHRFTQAFGSPNLSTVASLCESSGRMGKILTCGSRYVPDLQKTKTLLVWGANPTFSSPPFAHLVAAKAAAGHNLIVVDPVRTELARAATVHLQVRPGADLPLALGLIHVLIAENLYDRSFVAEQTVGFDALADLVKDYAPERVEGLTSVKVGDLRRAARLAATEGPTATWEGLGIEHHLDGVQTVRALSIFESLIGHLDQPGGSLLTTHAGPAFEDRAIPALLRMATPKPVPPPVEARPIGYDEYPVFETFNRQAQANLYARAILEDTPYPLRALILVGSNALVTSPDADRLQRAASKLSVLVTIDPFLTESGRRSHYVLPSCTFAEAPILDAEDHVTSEAGLVSPQHEAWPDWRIFFELARSLGLGTYFPWQSFEEAMRAPRFPYMADGSREIRPHRPAGSSPPRFPTPSGKIELFSETLRRFGQSPLPAPSSGDGPNGEFPLLLVSGPRTRPFINSQFHNIPSIVFKMPEPLATIHPITAQHWGLSEGDKVAIISERGQVEVRLSISDAVHPDAVVAASGWETPNVNRLTRDDRLDPISGFPAFRATRCRVEPARSFPLGTVVPGGT